MRVLICLPDRDFDPTEAGVTWRVLREAGFAAAFATPSGSAAEPDPHMISGDGLDPWGRIPLLDRLHVAGAILRADRRGREACAAMAADGLYRKPLTYAQLRVVEFDALVLPGGHYARGMRAYLESPVLQRFTASFFESGKPVAAICHGVVLAARAISPRTGRSVLYGRKTTALTWSQESLAARIGRVARFWDPDYYRTYPDEPDEPAGYRSVQAEVSRALAAPTDFLDVPKTDPDYARKTDGLHRDSPSDPRPAWVVRDGNYVSARWPGDAHTFANRFLEILRQTR